MDTEEIQKLSESIEKYGVLQPLSVRRLGRGYELLSGERRMRAAMLAGLSEVPCVIMDVNTRESAVLMLVENLLRRDLDFIEAARGLSRLVNMYGYSQEEAARLVGLTQPTVANKLRLLKMPPDLLLTIREAGLSERHARALLRLDSEEDMVKVLETVIKQDLNVAKTESFIEAFLENAKNPQSAEKPPAEPPQQKSVYVIRDPRLLVNSIARGVKLLRKSGVNVEMAQQETETSIILTVTIPK
jgi:ParB family chromosome partitioning protein